MTVPVIAQEKGFNIYLWIICTLLFGFLSYFLIKRLDYNHNKPIDINLSNKNAVKKDSIDNQVNF